jgi:hypothetical protein
MKHLDYACYLARHKYYVFLECWKLGIAWQGFVHDWSKFLPDEWLPYAEYFYGWGYNQSEFDKAWLLHQKRSPHHWQYWVLMEDSGKTKALDMPLRYRKEMLADWRGAGMAQGKPDTAAWYAKNKERMVLHPDTRAWIEKMLGLDSIH